MDEVTGIFANVVDLVSTSVRGLGVLFAHQPIYNYIHISGPDMSFLLHYAKITNIRGDSKHNFSWT